MKKNGFTLIELLAVVVIIGVLAVLATTAVVNRVEKAKKETYLINAKNILKTAEDYFTYIDTLNKLPKVKDQINEGIKLFYVKNYNKIKYYAFDLETIKDKLDIDDEYQAAIIVISEDDQVKTYISVNNNDFTMYYNEDDCLKSHGNQCFYQPSELKNEYIKPNKDVNYNKKTKTMKSEDITYYKMRLK